MERPALFVEPFVGAGAVWLRLVGGRQLQPPVSWMGGKRRYASHILGAMGLRSGLGCERLLLADAGTWGWVWPVLLAPASRDRVVATIRGWSDENPLELWDRLRATPPLEDVAERAAQWLWLQARAGSGVPVWWMDGEPVASDGRGDPRPVGQKGQGQAWVAPDKRGAVRASNLFQTKVPKLVQGDARGGHQPAGQRNPGPRLVQGERDRADGSRRVKLPGQTTFKNAAGAGGRIDIAAMADEIEQLAQVVAAWACLQAGGALGKEVAIDGEQWLTHGYAHLSDSGRERGFRERLLVEPLADRIAALEVPLPPLGVYHGRAEDLVPAGDHSRTWVYIDPPYVGCTSYEEDCTREAVLELARAWSDAGAVVAISEREPLDGELGDGWEAQDLTPLGRANSKPESLTLNRPARARVAVQLDFGWADSEDGGAGGVLGGQGGRG